MNVSLTPEIEKWIEERVAKGFYSSASEVLREGIRVLKDRDGVQDSHRAELNKAIDAGLNQAKNGKLLDGKEVMGKMRQRAEEFRRKKKAA